MISSGTLEAV